MDGRSGDRRSQGSRIRYRALPAQSAPKATAAQSAHSAEGATWSSRTRKGTGFRNKNRSAEGASPSWPHPAPASKHRVGPQAREDLLHRMGFVHAVKVNAGHSVPNQFGAL